MAIRTALFKGFNDKATYTTFASYGATRKTIHLLNLDSMNMSSQSCSFELLDHIKTRKPNKRESSSDIGSYQPNNTLSSADTERVPQENRASQRHRKETV